MTLLWQCVKIIINLCIKGGTFVLGRLPDFFIRMLNSLKTG